MRLTGSAFARHRRRPGAGPQARRRDCASAIAAARSRARARAARRGPRAVARAARSRSRTASPAPRRRARVAVRRAAADARRSDAGRARRRRSSATERLNAEWALQRAFDEISALFDEAQDAYLRERKGDVADVVGRLRMNLRHGGDPRDLFADLEGPLVLVADELTPSVVAQVDWPRFAGSPPTRAAGPITPRSWRARFTCRRSSACTTRARLIAPGALRRDRRRHRRSVRRSRSPTTLGAGARAAAASQAYEQSLDEYRDAAGGHRRTASQIRLDANIEIARRRARARGSAGADGHRPVPIGVPARRRRPGGADRRRAVCQVYRGWSRAWRPAA